MKKMFLVGALALFGAVNAQETGNFKLGAHVGIPTGDLSKGYSVNVGFDAAYVYPIAENFKLGLTSGYSHYVGKTYKETFLGATVSYKAEDVGIIPVAATAQYQFGGANVFVGVDLGYAFFTGKDSSTGGFYYQPKVGYTFVNKHDLYVAYKGIAVEGGNAGSVNLGYAYNF